jgi:hypothetical protein
LNQTKGLSPYWFGDDRDAGWGSSDTEIRDNHDGALIAASEVEGK